MNGARSKRFAAALLAAALLMASPPAGAADNGAAESLNERIARAKPGDTIVLAPGFYEGPVVIDRPLVLRSSGEGQAVLRNESRQPALTVASEDVTVAGLAIEDEARKEAPSVLVTGRGAWLHDLHVRTGSDGIAIRDADGVRVSGCVVEWAPAGVRTADKGNGIDLFNAHGAELRGNVIRDVHDGIYIENSDDVTVTGNRIENSRYGIHTMYANRTVIQGNYGQRNVTGAMVMAARNTEISGNTFTKQSENVHSQGLLLYDAHDTRVTGNLAEGNRVGFYVELSTNNVFAQNRILNNYMGLQLIEAENNLLTENLFAGNVAHALAKDSTANNLDGNHWDTFRGLDTDGDGRSEMGYAINPFFQGLTAKRPAFQIFFQSPGMVFLEGLYQADKGTWAMDGSPLMKRPETLRAGEGAADARQTGLAGLILTSGAVLILIWARRRDA